MAILAPSSDDPSITPRRLSLVETAPLPELGDLRRLTLDGLYDASQRVADWCCYGIPADLYPCLRCPNTGPAEALYDRVAAEIETRPEHRRAVAAMARRMRGRL